MAEAKAAFRPAASKIPRAPALKPAPLSCPSLAHHRPGRPAASSTDRSGCRFAGPARSAQELHQSDICHLSVAHCPAIQLPPTRVVQLDPNRRWSLRIGGQLECRPIRAHAVRNWLAAAQDRRLSLWIGNMFGSLPAGWPALSSSGYTFYGSYPDSRAGFLWRRRTPQNTPRQRAGNRRCTTSGQLRKYLVWVEIDGRWQRPFSRL